MDLLSALGVSLFYRLSRKQHAFRAFRSPLAAANQLESTDVWERIGE